MSVVFIPGGAPSYNILSTDITAGSTADGVSYIGAMVRAVDTGKTYMVMPDLTLLEFTFPVSSTGGGSSSASTVNVASMPAITGTVGVSTIAGSGVPNVTGTVAVSTIAGSGVPTVTGTVAVSTIAGSGVPNVTGTVAVSTIAGSGVPNMTILSNGLPVTSSAPFPVVVISGSAASTPVPVSGSVTIPDPVQLKGKGRNEVVAEISYDNPLPVTSGSNFTVLTIDSWRVALTSEEIADNSDKTFTVPILREWQVLWAWVEFTSCSVVGARQIEIQIQDSGSDIIAEWQAGVTQAASLTYNYLFGLGMPDLTAVRDTNFVMTPMPIGMFLSAGQKIRIFDNNAVDATHDDMIIQMQYAYRPVTVAAS